MKRNFPTSIEALAHLYEWRTVATATSAKPLYDSEDLLIKNSIKTRLRQVEDEVLLEVPISQFEIAKALIEGTVKEVITLPPERYQLFHDDLSLRKSHIAQGQYGVNRKAIRNMRYLLIGLIVSVLLIFFKLYKF